MDDRTQRTSVDELFELITTGLALADGDGRLLRANSALCRMLGTAEAELLGQPWQLPAGAPDHPDAAADDRAEPAACWRTGLRQAEADNRMSVTPAPAGVGGAVLIQVCAAPALREPSEATLLGEVVSNLPVVLFASDLDGVCTLSEGELLAGLGLARGEIVGLSLYEVYRAHPDIGESLRKAMAGESFATMAQVAGIAFETYYRPLHDAAGVIVGAVGVAIDVTQRVQAEEALRRSETITTSLLDTMPCTLYRIDGDELVLTLKPEPAAPGVESHGVVSSAPSRPLGDVFSPETAAELDRCMRRALETAQAQSVDFEVADTGGRRYFDAQVVPSDNEHAMLVVRDVTERRQLEVELRHAQKLEAIGRLAAGLAHEINTPVQFVGDNMNFLSEAFTDLLSLATAHSPDGEAMAASDWDFLQAEVPLAIAQTQEGIHRVSTIVRALKSFAHPSGRSQAPADLNKALQDTLVVAGSEYRMIADVSTDFADLPPVVCHLSDLNQVFLNLLVNASHAIADHVGSSGERGVITVRTRVQGQAVSIEIVDNGAGIPTDIHQRVFEPFFTTKEVGRGTGQGLAFARSIVNERHGGSITFSCPPEGGTVFTVQLPVAGAAPQGSGPDGLHDPAPLLTGAGR